MPSKSNNAKIISANLDSADAVELKAQLVRSQVKLNQTEMLLSVAKRIAGLQNLTEILWTLIEMTTEELGAERGTLFLNDPLSGELYSRLAQGDLTRARLSWS